MPDVSDDALLQAALKAKGIDAAPPAGPGVVPAQAGAPAGAPTDDDALLMQALHAHGIVLQNGPNAAVAPGTPLAHGGVDAANAGASTAAVRAATTKDWQQAVAKNPALLSDPQNRARFQRGVAGGTIDPHAAVPGDPGGRTLLGFLKNAAADVPQVVKGVGAFLGHVGAGAGDMIAKYGAAALGDTRAAENYDAAERAHADALTTALVPGTLRDLTTAAGYAAGGQPGMAGRVAGAIPGNYARSLYEHPVQAALAAAPLVAPALGAAGRAAGGAGRMAEAGARLMDVGGNPLEEAAPVVPPLVRQAAKGAQSHAEALSQVPPQVQDRPRPPQGAVKPSPRQAPKMVLPHEGQAPGIAPEITPQLHPTAPGENGAARAADGKFVEASDTPPPAPQAAPKKGLPKIENSAGAFGGKAVSDLIEHATDAAQDFFAAHVGHAADQARELAGVAAHFSAGGRYRASYAFSPEVGDALNKAAASREQALTYAAMADRYVHQGLSPDQRDLLGRYYADQRAQALEAQGTAGHNVPKLTPAEAQQVAADPQIQRAIQRYEQQPGAYLLQARRFVSPRLKPVQTPNGHFAPLLPEGKAAASGRPGGPLASQQRMKGTGGARQATGQAAGYVTDLGQVLRHAVPEVVGKVNQRHLYKTLLAQRDSAGNRLAFTNVGGQKLPEKITWEGKEHDASAPIEIAQVNTPKGAVSVRMVVPRELAGDINDVTTNIDRVRSGGEVLRRAAGLATALSLTSPAEVLYHANRVLSLAKTVPGMTTVPGVAGRAQALARLINLDMSHPDNVAALQRLMEANAGSSRPFAHQGGEANPVARFNHGTLFGLPEGKGLGQLASGNFGLDLRLRVAAENLRAKVEGNTDPRRVREFAGQFGQYTAKPDPLIEGARVVHPFAASSLPMRVTEVRQLMGDAGLKGLTPKQWALTRAHSLAAGAGGTALGMVLLNHALSGHWPWQNAPGHEFDVQAGRDRDGRPVYISGNAVAPALSRPLRMLGADRMAENARGNAHGAALADKQAQALGRGLGNAGLEELNSPLAAALLAGTTGKAAYITPKGDFLQVAGHAKGGQSQALLNLLAGAQAVLPVKIPAGAGRVGGGASALVRAGVGAGVLKKDAPKGRGGSPGSLGGGLGRPSGKL